MDRGSRILDEIKGVLAAVAGIIVLISLITHDQWDDSVLSRSAESNNLLGSFGSNLSTILFQTIGYAAYIIPVAFLIYGIKKFLGKMAERKLLFFVISIIVLMISVSSISSIFADKYSGGTVGILISSATLKAFSTTGSYIILITAILISLMYIFQFSLATVAKTVKSKAEIGSRALSDVRERRREKEKKSPRIKVEDDDLPESRIVKEVLPSAGSENREKPARKIRPKSRAKKSGEYELPGLDLLHDSPPSVSKPTRKELLERSELLEKKLEDYSIEGKVTHVSPGPIVTMFEYEPAPGIKISKVVSLADDLAMALRASSVRISPIHGRSTLGIEVPNKNIESVFLKDILSNDSFIRSNARLNIALGKDIFGTPVMTDLAKMPHLLIAGATGSGKSVGMNTIVLSLLFNSTPKEVKMLMIDPKMLELSAYEEIPHLLMPVITLPKEASNALKKLVFEMERRYRLLADSGARNIEAYNRKIRAEAEKKSSSSSEDSPEPLPYIVIFIDELADLMFASGREVEDSIARLAGMARAAGIHLVLATQRPSVDVITGIIKANFPSRISFQVSSKMDSRIILDTYGADQLLGKGDMLFTSPGHKIKRIHGAYVSEEEIKNVAEFIKSQEGPDYTLFENLESEMTVDDDAPERDDLYNKAKDIVLSTGQASISYIQRRMKIGYNRAARIMEELEEDGIVGPPVEAGKPREVLRRH